MAVKKISPKNPDAKASAAKGDKKADERKTASEGDASTRTTMHKNCAHLSAGRFRADRSIRWQVRRARPSPLGRASSTASPS